MSKKAGKFLFGAALVGAAVAGGIAYLNKCKNEKDTFEDDFDEFQDDFEDDLDEEESASSPSREYVTIPKEGAQEEGTAPEKESAANQEEDAPEEKEASSDASQQNA